MSDQTKKPVYINRENFTDKIKSYLRHPGSMILMFLVMLATFITFALLLFLIFYILINGIPYIKPSLFSLHYTSDNASVIPALINTVVMTLLSLLIAVPFGIFSAIFLVEYAGKGNKFIEVIRPDDGDSFGHSVYRIWSVWYAVLCKYAEMGIFRSGRCIYFIDHDSSADHAPDRRST